MDDGAQYVRSSPVPKPHPLVIGLSIVFALFFVLQTFVPAFRGFAFDALALNPAAALHHGWVWQLVTCVFVQPRFLAFLFYLFLLLFLGSPVSNAWRTREFTIYLALCAVAGPVSFLLFSQLFGVGGPWIGPGSLVFGLTAAYGLVFGKQTVLLFFLFRMKAEIVVVGLLAVTLLGGILFRGALFGTLANLSGALVGWLYVKTVWKRQDRLAGNVRQPTVGKITRIGGLEVMDDDRS